MASSPETTFVRFFHALALDFPILFYCDDIRLTKKTEYECFSKYFELPSGNHIFRLVHQETQAVLFEKRVNLRPYSIFSYILCLKSQALPTSFTLFSVEENFRLSSPAHAFIRLHHFSPTAPIVSLFNDDDSVLFKSIRYGDSTKYIPIEPKRLSLELKHFDTSTDFLRLSSFQFKPNRFYSFYLIGSSLTDKSPYQLIPSIDGNSFLQNKKPPKPALESV